MRGSPSTCSTRRATRISAHWDFSEDTYRTLTAVAHPSLPRSRGRVGGGLRRRPQWRQGGIEEQTRKLFEVCRLRDVPIITFVNKLDREGRDPFDLLDEIEQSLALDVTPASWPIGMGRDFLGTYDLFADALLLFERGVHDRVTEPVRCSGLDDPKLPRLLPKAALAKLREEVEMAKGLCPPFDARAYREGHLTPVYFGSALNNFGVRELMRGVAKLARRHACSRPKAPMDRGRSCRRSRGSPASCSRCRPISQ